MIKQLVNTYVTRRTKRACARKWQEIMKATPPPQPDKILLTAYTALWAKLDEKPAAYYPAGYAAISGVADSHYVPEDIYYTRLEPVLNHRSFAAAYADKNFYQKFLPQQAQLFPRTYLRGINGMLMNAAYEKINSYDEATASFEEGKDYIFKPSVDTSGGLGVQALQHAKGFFQVKEDAVKAAEFLQQLQAKHSNFIIQEKINPHSWFAAFNPSSLNTVRVFTYRSVKDETVHTLSAVLRFGKAGSIVDNQAAGGFTCGISQEGKLNSFACSKTGRLPQTPGAVAAQAGQLVPGYEKMMEQAKAIAPAYGYHRLLGFDFCVNAENEVKLLEINCKNIEINFLQMNNGPLFGALTEEVIAYCASHKKNIVLDFSV